ncbi:hypothetical protein AZ78_3055 [Lysobacter capsici AZ78]|uniref:Uncharacterized protein n=1 Tax=Lysobacter capsici AZ78 TaxID=1444315 RepID=A0A108UAD7_9GAMM|nr:hypothetical protein AZ78_3055 [Lysobacter capsici AZ78]
MESAHSVSLWAFTRTLCLFNKRHVMFRFATSAGALNP